MKDVVLLLDVGNSRAKFIEYDGQQVSHCKSDMAEIEQKLSNYSSVRITGLYLANVASRDIEHQIEAWCRRQNIEFFKVESESSQAGLVNGYKNPQQLGVDRWLSMLACWSKQQRAFLLVSCGTAVTLDAVNDEGRHMGGYILPGLHGMWRSLFENTTNLPEIKTPGTNFVNLGQETQTAMTNGVIFAILAAVNSLHTALQRQHNSVYECILTGGDAELISPHLEIIHRVEHNLVLQGLSRCYEMSKLK